MRICFGQMNYGLGTHIEYMAAAFGRALELNRTFVLPSSPGLELQSIFGTAPTQYGSSAYCLSPHLLFVDADTFGSFMLILF